MAVRAKFRVNCVVPAGGDAVRIDLHPVYDSDPNSENGQFFSATPWGQITLGTVNAAASSQFKPGAEFYVDFTEIPK